MRKTFIISFWFCLLLSGCKANNSYPVESQIDNQLSEVSSSGTSEVLYAKTPRWVIPAKFEADVEFDNGKELEFLIYDQQTHFGKSSTHVYYDQAAIIHGPQGLQAAGGLSAQWDPSYQSLSIHQVSIIRDDKILDALQQEKTFEVIRREENLEQSYLDGMQTAIMQIEGLEVGDIVQFNFSIESINPILKGESWHMSARLNTEGIPNARKRFVWPTDVDLNYYTSVDPDLLSIESNSSFEELTIDLSKIRQSETKSGAPLRYNLGNMIEFSSVETWAQFSSTYWPYFQEASQFASGSDLDRYIRELNSEDISIEQKIEKTIQFTQTDVRYLYDGLSSGAYIPAKSDVVFERRIGDCKGKTALLLAILSELGIKAEPVLVSTQFGNIIPERLPNLSLFDHVIVKANINGKDYWLDGARTGDRILKRISPDNYEWGLPLRENGAELIQIKPTFPVYLTTEYDVFIDASEGLAVNSPIKAKITLRGNGAGNVKSAIALQGDRVKSTYYSILFASLGKVLDEDFSHYFDPETGDLSIEMSGKYKFESTGSSTRRNYKIPGFSYFWELPMAYNSNLDTSREEPWIAPFPTNNNMKVEIIFPEQAEQKFYYDEENFSFESDTIQMARQFKINGEKAVLSRSLQIRDFEIANSELVNLANEIDRYSEGWTAYFYSTDIMADDGTFSKPVSLDSKQSRIDQGVIFMDMGELEKALKEFDAVLNWDEENDFAWANRGVANVWLENHSTAKSDLERALKINPDNWVALQGMGFLKMETSDCVSAIRYFDQVIRKRGSALFSKIRRIVCLTELFRFDEAIHQVDEMIKRNPSDEDLIRIKDEVLHAQEEYIRMKSEVTDSDLKMEIEIPRIVINK